MSVKLLVFVAVAATLLIWGATAFLGTAAVGADRPVLVVDYPQDGSVFPPDFTQPTFLWHDSSKDTDTWRIEIRFADDGEALLVTSDGPPAPVSEIDPDAIGATNSLYEGTPYQQTARSWTPEPDVWAEIKRRSVEGPAVFTFRGYSAAAPDEMLTSGKVRITTSKDPIGAPLFYRDVPLMAGVGKDGVIAPLDPRALPRIKWRLRDLSLPESRVLLTGVPACANCHTFSADGAKLAMDVDGPSGDKGAYAVAPIDEVTVIEKEHVITWNSFKDKPEGHRTIGFLSRISPDGKYVVSTLNEDLYVSNFQNFAFLQVFFPAQGILAWYSEETGEIKALPGADDPAYVHCDAAWFPDGKDLVFMRAKEFEPHPPGRKLARYPNDPIEPRIQYDLYRIPFNDGKGGTAVPIKGASANGSSNTFPRVSPDGKWIVFTKCRNGMLMRPDGRLWIVPSEGGEAREMRCNTPLMNSWHSFTPNGRWLVFSSKSVSPYTQFFLTHIDEDGNDTPAILVPNSTASNRAANIPEFVNRSYDSFKAIDLVAANHHRFLHEGIKLALEGKFAEAVTCFEKSLDNEPEFTRALGHYGRALLELGRVKEAREVLHRTLKLDPDFPFVHVTLGVSYMREGDRKTAERYFLHALDLDTKNHMAYYNMAVLRLEQDRVEEAIEYAQAASAQDPCDADTSNLLGWGLMRRRQWEDAGEAFRAALAHDADHKLAQENLLTILRREGPPEELLAHLEAMVKSRPDEVEIGLGLAWELSTRPESELRDGKRAVELATAAHKVIGDRPDVLDVLAAALAEAGRYEEAVKVATQALALVKAGRGKTPPGLEKRLAGYREGKAVR